MKFDAISVSVISYVYMHKMEIMQLHIQFRDLC